MSSSFHVLSISLFIRFIYISRRGVWVLLPVGSKQNRSRLTFIGVLRISCRYSGGECAAMSIGTNMMLTGNILTCGNTVPSEFELPIELNNIAPVCWILFMAQEIRLTGALVRLSRISERKYLRPCINHCSQFSYYFFTVPYCRRHPDFATWFIRWAIS